MTGPLVSASGALALTGHEVERHTARRGDEDFLAAAWADPATRVLVVSGGQARARMGDGAAELVFVPPAQAPEGIRFLLGEDHDGTAHFGVLAPLPDSGADGDPSVISAGLREVGVLLTSRDAALLAHAVGLANWHEVSLFCSRCGSPTEPVTAGHVRRCPADGSEHFPRCDPAVIMAVIDPADRLLLARNAQWPPRRVSVLAGFVEPGESAEQAVAREVHEETGVVVGAVTYAGSQPWPMPHSLMLGFRAEATGTDITVDKDEIAEATWYSRDDLREALVSGALMMPPSLSISRWLIETWYGGDLPGKSARLPQQ